MDGERVFATNPVLFVSTSIIFVKQETKINKGRFSHSVKTFGRH